MVMSKVSKKKSKKIIIKRTVQCFIRKRKTVGKRKPEAGPDHGPHKK